MTTLATSHYVRQVKLNSNSYDIYLTGTNLLFTWPEVNKLHSEYIYKKNKKTKKKKKKIPMNLWL